MQDFLVVAMLNSQSDLREPVEKFIFSHVVLLSLTVDRLEALLNLSLQVTIVGVIHHNTELALLGLIDFAELYDVWMAKDLKNLRLV